MALSKVDGCLCSGRAVVDHDMSGLEAGLDMVVAMIGAEAYVWSSEAFDAEFS
jgi:hypothetical protein